VLDKIAAGPNIAPITELVSADAGTEQSPVETSYSDEGGSLRSTVVILLLMAGLLAGCGKKAETVSTDTAVTETVAPEAVTESPATENDATAAAQETAQSDESGSTAGGETTSND